MRKSLFIPKTTIVNKNKEILSICRNKTVLDIGMGGYIDDADKNNNYLNRDLNLTLHGLLSKEAKVLDGLDINEDAVKAMSERFPGQYFIGDLTDENLSQKINQKYDIIVFGDVIEHLDNPQVALQNLKSLLNEDGIIIITTVHAYCIDSILKMLLRYECVHEEHTCYFSYVTMRRLLHMNGFQIEQFYFYRNQPKQWGSLFHYLGVKFKNVFTSLFPQFEMGLFFVVKPGASVL